MIIKQKIILIGGGGHCKACIDVIEQENKYEIFGILDIKEKVGKSILGYKIIGVDDDIIKYIKEGYNFLITLGHIGKPDLREKLFKMIKNLNGNFATVISPFAYISQRSKIGEGTIIMHHALINTNTVIGNNCIINSKGLIEHDAIIGNNCHISTGSIINGGVKIGNNCFHGSNSVSMQYISIADNTIIGAGSVVTKDITESGVYVGIPARKVK